MNRRRIAIAMVSIAAFLLGGCGGESSPAAPTPPALFDCLVGDALHLAVGDVAQASGSEVPAVCLTASERAEYLYVPFFASSSGSATLQVEVAGGGSGEPQEASTNRGPAPAHIPAGATATALGVSGPPPLNEAFHLALRERERRELTPRVPGARLAYDAAGGILAARARRGASPPPVGRLLTLNTATSCERERLQTGRVEAVGEHAIIVADTANPAGGFTDDDWEFFAAAMDTLVWPVDVRNFGEPTDIDRNGRVIVFFTRAVNELTPPSATSFIAGFFWSGDLFPEDSSGDLTGCPGSNTGEIFYQFVPDPRGELGRRHSVEFVRRISLAIVGHELQHLINASRRLYINRTDAFEESWLNEGLSHVAEELLFYAASPAAPRSDLDVTTLTTSPAVLAAFNAYAIANLRNYGQYLQDPEQSAVIGIANLPTRGASWAFLRYIADRHPGPDEDLFFDLVNGQATGLANLSAAVDAEGLAWLQDWTVSVFADDAGLSVDDPYRQPSWDFRSVVPALRGDQKFPLTTRRVPSEVQQRFSLSGGGAAFLRFGVDPGTRAVLELTSGDGDPPAALRTSLVRIR